MKIGQRLRRWFTRYREYILIVLILSCLTCLFLSDVIFDGKILLAADIALQYEPWSSAGPHSPPHNSILGDSIMWYYPAKHFFWQSIKRGHFPKWNPYIYSGHPFSPLSGGQSSDLGQLLTEFPALFLPVERALGYVAAFRLVLAGLFMYAFLRDLRASVYGSLLAAIIFMFNANTIAWLEFPAHLSIQLWIPLVFLLFHRALRLCSGQALTRETLAYAVLTAASLGLLLFNWYLLLAIYTLSGLALFALWMIWRTYFQQPDRDLRRLLRQLAISAGSVGAGISMAAVKIISYRLLLDASIRGDQSALRALRSVPLTLETLRELVARSVTFFVPAFYGNGASMPYWGWGNAVEAAQYFGIITIMLVAIAIALGRKNRYALFFAGMGLLFLLIMWRVPPFVNLYGYIPSAHFSPISRIVTFVLFAFAVAAGLGLTYLEKGLREGERRRAYLGVGLAAIVALVVVGWNWLSQAEAISARPYETGHLRWFLLMLSISLGVMVLLIQSRFNKRLLAQIAVAILVADLFAFGLDFNTTVNAESVYPVTDSISFLQRDKSTYRVFPLSGHDFLFLPNSLTVYRIPEVTGYDNPLSQRYADFFREVIGDTEVGLNGVILSASPNRLHLLGMLNVKYIIGPSSPSFENLADLELVYDGEVKIYRNRRFLPRAFAVHGSKVLQGKERILAELKDPQFDPCEYVILEETPQTSEVSQGGFARQIVRKAAISPLKRHPLDLGGLTTGTRSQSPFEVTILRAGVDEIELAAEMEDEGFVVLSNQYYPGWRAYVDGREERIYRANYILMAVPLAEGSHTVKFVYQPPMHQINLLARFIVPLGLIGVLLFRRYSA
ncbi:MAG: YfhO family protein [Anaerolineae bacterium]|nr:YfhO family protein [Anaerolineae bacterium]